MREQDGPHGGVQPYAPQVVEESAAADEREEGRTDDDRRQHERDRHDRPQDVPAREVEAREDIRAGERDQQRERGGRERLPGGEPEDVPDVGLTQHIPDAPQLPGAVDLETPPDDRGDGVGEEHREERDGHGHETEPRRVAPVFKGPPRGRFGCFSRFGYFSTSEVHDLTHWSRSAAIFAGAMVSGSGAWRPYFSNSCGTWAPWITG